MGAVEQVLAALLSLSPYSGDVAESFESRTQLVDPVAAAIVAATSDTRERAFLVAQAWHETKLARYVLEERCQDGPAGAQCDEGRAIGPWQAHCREAHQAATLEERYVAGARCSLRQWRYGLARCKGAEQAGFLAQHGGIMACSSKRYADRVRTMRRVFGLLRNES